MIVAKTIAAKERPEGTERRTVDRRTTQAEVGTDRRKVQRRRQIDPTTCERDYSDDEIEFMQAMDNYKRDSGRMFPTCSEMLEVLRSIGYIRLDDEQREILGLELAELPVGPSNTASEEDEIGDEAEEELNKRTQIQA